ncbi:hypothetical protein FOZ63_000227 [Perkinsus olseni]|uniref:Uncharacterized protein n=1 Tax=Perkinsus olseni TaxID=32597 RepID=A0A7J6TC29_PEROL|nr:hypothetical protein FOZ63_000227 [Perkinsus olseni]
MNTFLVHFALLILGVVGNDTTGFGTATTIATQSPAGSPTTGYMTTASDVSGGPGNATSVVPTTAANTTTVMACPTGFCHDTQFNPGSNTTCIYPDPVKLMDCWEDYCSSVEAGGYCLVWEPPSGRVCHGGMKKCYCSEYKQAQAEFYPADAIPSGWEQAQECDYSGATGGTTQTPPPPPKISGAKEAMTLGACSAAAVGIIALNAAM